MEIKNSKKSNSRQDHSASRADGQMVDAVPGEFVRLAETMSMNTAAVEEMFDDMPRNSQLSPDELINELRKRFECGEVGCPLQPALHALSRRKLLLIITNVSSRTCSVNATNAIVEPWGTRVQKDGHAVGEVDINWFTLSGEDVKIEPGASICFKVSRALPIDKVVRGVLRLLVQMNVLPRSLIV